MAWLPGPVPVANEVQATGDWGGMVEARGRKSPRVESARRFGSLPSSIQRVTNRGSTPSKPRITRRRAGRSALCSPPQPPIPAATAAASSQRRRSPLLLGEPAFERPRIGDHGEFLIGGPSMPYPPAVAKRPWRARLPRNPRASAQTLRPGRAPLLLRFAGGELGLDAAAVAGERAPDEDRLTLLRAIELEPGELVAAAGEVEQALPIAAGEAH